MKLNIKMTEELKVSDSDFETIMAKNVLMNSYKYLKQMKNRKSQ